MPLGQSIFIQAVFPSMQAPLPRRLQLADRFLIIVGRRSLQNREHEILRIAAKELLVAAMPGACIAHPSPENIVVAIGSADVTLPVTPI